MAKKEKFYVVWQGLTPGIYTDWRSCEAQIKGVGNARYKSFGSMAEAQAAFADGPTAPVASVSGRQHRSSVLQVDASGIVTLKPGVVDGPILNSIAVDAACSGNPGVMEYQGVYVASSTQLFHFKTPVGTNNIGEFLAIVHGLSYIKKHNLNMVLYSDSVNGLSWVRQKLCKSKLPVNEKTRDLWDYVHRAERWLQTNTFDTKLIKWDTDRWGEVPADFGRK